MDLNSLQEALNSLKKIEQPKWLSRKLLVTVGVVIFLMWFGRDNISTILLNLTILTVVWLICTTVVDIVTLKTQSKINEKIVDALGKDGLTQKELDAIAKLRGSK
jgi:cell division protein FtsB